MSEAAVTGTGDNQPAEGGVSEETLEQLRRENAALVEEIAEAERDRAEAEAEHAKNIEMGQLLTEQARLQARLAQAQGVADAARATADSDALVGQIKDQLFLAVEQSKVTSGPVDTNSGYVTPENELPSAQDKVAAEAASAEEALPDQPESSSPTSSTPTGVNVDQSSTDSEPDVDSWLSQSTPTDTEVADPTAADDTQEV